MFEFKQRKMIIFTHKDKEYPIKNKGEEITLAELDTITQISNDNTKSYYTRWLNIIEFLGGKQLANVISDKGLGEYISHFEGNNIKNDIVNTLNINGKEYTCELENERIVLLGREIAKIEEYMKKESDWASYLFAIVYKEQGINSADHLNDGHIKKKLSLFKKNVTANIAAPVIFQVSQQIIENVEKMSKAIKEN